jgi:hypothetical protein
MVKVKENYFRTKCMPAGILLNVKAVICLKCELQLKFRSNKNYSYIIVNFCTGLH